MKRMGWAQRIIEGKRKTCIKDNANVMSEKIVDNRSDKSIFVLE